MTTVEKRAIISVLCAVTIVFSFLFGYLVAEADWFRPVKVSIFQVLGKEP